MGNKQFDKMCFLHGNAPSKGEWEHFIIALVVLLMLSCMAAAAVMMLQESWDLVCAGSWCIL